MVQKFYGTATIRSESGKATHVETETRRGWRYQDLSHETVSVIELESSGLDGAKTYLCAVRARTHATVEGTNTTTISLLTDAVAPSAPTVTVAVV